MNVVYHLDTQGLKNQRTCLKKKKRKGRFSATGLDMVYSLDGKVPHRSHMLIDPAISFTMTLFVNWITVLWYYWQSGPVESNQIHTTCLSTQTDGTKLSFWHGWANTFYYKTFFILNLLDYKSTTHFFPIPNLRYLLCKTLILTLRNTCRCRQEYYS